MGILTGVGISYDDYDVGVNESYSFEVGGDKLAYQEFIEEMTDVYKIMHSLDILEISIIKRHNAVSLEGCGYDCKRFEIVQEAGIQDIFNKLKSLLKSLWEKIKGFFKSIRKFFDYLFMDANQFIRKYEKTILKSATNADSDFKYEMINYNDSRINKVTDSSVNPYNILESKIDNYCGKVKGDELDSDNIFKDKNEKVYKLINDDADELETRIYEDFRSSIIGKNTSKSDFSDDLFGYFRNDANDKSDTDEKTANDIPSIIQEIKDNKRLLSDLDKMEKTMNKSFKNTIKDLDKIVKFNSKETDKSLRKNQLIKWLTRKTSVFQTCQSISTTFVTAWRVAIKDRDKDYKSACMAVMRYKNKS